MMRSVVALALFVLWANLASAQTYTAEHRLDLRITGVLLAPDTPAREDIVTVDISVQNTPMVLRLGKVEELTAREKSQADKGDVLFKKVRFTGPEELMTRMLNPETIGKVLTIEGWLNTQARIFQVTTVNEGSTATPTAQ